MSPPPQRRPAEPKVATLPEAAAIPRAPWLAALRARAIAWAAWLPAALFLMAVLAPPLNHDVAAVLNFAERWLAGERLYSDLIDVNPPLVFVLNLLPAAIAAWTPLDGVQALLLCLLALAAGTWRLTVALRRGLAEGPVERAVLDAAVPLLLLIAGYDFGQREQMMGLAALPYAALAARRIEGRPVPRGLMLGTVLLAAPLFALKPHFLAAPALIEALVLARRGWGPALRDPVPWLMAGCWLLYLASVPLLFPDYLGHVVPLVWDYYVTLGVYDHWDVLISNQLGPALVALLAVLPLALRPAAGPFAQALAMGAAGAFLSAWVQHKGWSYHVVPVVMLVAAAGAAAAARWLDTHLPEPRARAAAPALALAATLGIAGYALRGGEAPWRQLWFNWDRAGQITALLKQEAYGERLLVLSPDIYPVHPALNYAQAQSTLRTMNLWLLQGVYRDCPADGARYRDTWAMSRTEFFVYRTVAEDFSRAPPAAVLVSDNPGIPVCGRPFDIIEYFSRHPLFAETWQRYRRTASVEGYRLYTRED